MTDERDDWGEPRGQARRRKRRKPVLSVVAIVLFAIGLVVFANFYAMRSGSSKEVLKTLGYAATLEELDASYAVPAGVHNAADDYLRVFEQINQIREESSELYMRCEELIDEAEDAGNAYPPELYALLDEYLTAYAPVLEIVKALEPGGACRYLIDLKAGADVELIHLAKARELARLFRFVALHAAHDGDGEAAMEALQSGLTAAASLKNEPVLISQLVRWAMLEIMIHAVDGCLGDCALSDAQLVALDAMFAKAGDGIALGRVMAADYLMTLDIMEKSRQERRWGVLRDVVDSVRNLLETNHGWEAGGAWTEAALEQGLEDAQLSERAFAQRYRVALEQDFRARTGEPNTARTLPFGPYYDGAPTYSMLIAYNVMRTSLRMARCMIAIERYRLAEGALPADLGGLAPRFLPAVPEDPYGDGPLRYRLLDSGYVLYSVSENFQDDGGVLGALQRRKGKDWGYVVRYACG